MARHRARERRRADLADRPRRPIPLRDDGLYRGDGVFEVIRLYGGRPFALGEHLDRLERSAAAIELPVERAALEREIDALLAELRRRDEAQLRIVLTRGGRRIAAHRAAARPRASSVTPRQRSPTRRR